MELSHFKCRAWSCSGTVGSGISGTEFHLPQSAVHRAPDRLVDVKKIKLDLNVSLQEKKLWGKVTTTGVVRTNEVTQWKFDAEELKVHKVLSGDGTPLPFDQDAHSLLVTLPKKFRRGEEVSVTVEYSVTQPQAGLYFIAPTEDQPGRPWQLWTQGQDEDNRYWFPCHDSPNEKASTEMIITVDKGFSGISNGKLLSKKDSADGKKTTFHWLQEIPHASYLVTLCVGEFVEINDQWVDSKGKIVPVQYYTLKGREEETKFCFSQTGKMIDFFSKKIGVDYPFEKYAQVVAWDFIYGGMENTSSTTQTEYTLHPAHMEEDYSSEPLVAHELAHQWFGDLLTCKEWRHAWLNEGFATYFESLWCEHAHGIDESLYEIYANELIYKDEVTSAYSRPIITNYYISPSDIFDRHLYEKGGRVLHMLRKQVGDELWWKSIGHYVCENFGKTVETIDLERSFEEVTGYSLSWFFDQWVRQSKHPKLSVNAQYDKDSQQLKLTIAQKQKRGSGDSWYQLQLPIKIKTKSGEIIQKTLTLREQEHVFSIPCAGGVGFVNPNEGNTILADWEWAPSREELIAQLSEDSDMMGRLWAAKLLGKDLSRASSDSLGDALTKENFWGVKVEILQALANIGSDHCYDIVRNFVQGKATGEHAKVRAAAVKALGRFKKASSMTLLKSIFETETSPNTVQAAAVAIGLCGSLEAKDESKEYLLNQFQKRTIWHDYADVGIVNALAEYSPCQKVLGLLKNATLGKFSMFVRRSAVDALAKFGRANPVLVLDTLKHLTKDENFFVRLYAVHALESLGDMSSLAALQRVADGVVEPRTHRAALVAMKTLRDGKTTNETVEKLKAELDELKERLQKITSLVEKKHSEDAKPKVLL